MLVKVGAHLNLAPLGMSLVRHLCQCLLKKELRASAFQNEPGCWKDEFAHILKFKIPGQSGERNS